MLFYREAVVSSSPSELAVLEHQPDADGDGVNDGVDRLGTGRSRRLASTLETLTSSIVKPGLVLAAAIVVWSVVQYVHVWQRHDRFGTFDNDLGFHTQYVWQLAHGRSFSTILGLPAFGHNATYGYYLLVPLSWLGIGPHGLNLVQTLTVALGAVPVFLLARDRLRNGWLAAAAGVAWLLNPLVQANVWETFHPETMAMTPLLWAYLMASRQRWMAFSVCGFLAVVWKADVALFLFVLGLIVARRWHRRVGLATAGLAAMWFLVTVMIVIPKFASVDGGDGTVFGPLYGELGDTPVEVATTGITDPGLVWSKLDEHEPGRYGRDLLAPYGFVSLLSPSTLALGLPQAAISLLSDQPFTRDPFRNPHYQAIPAVALALAMVEGVARLARRRFTRARGAIGLVSAFALATSASWGTLAFSVRSDGYWVAEGDPFLLARRAAVALVPDEASISAQYLIVPQLAERESVYSFPNPWRKVFYGVKGTPAPDPAVVEYVLQDESLTEGDGLVIWQCLLDSGAFDEVFRLDPIVLLRRVPTSDGGPVADLVCQDPPE